MVTLFIIGYFGFLVGYPLLQLWTLLRCRGWWRALSSFLLIPAIPLYAWAIFHTRTGGDLSALVCAPLGLIFDLYLIALGLGFEMMCWRTRRALGSGGLVKIDSPA